MGPLVKVATIITTHPQDLQPPQNDLHKKPAPHRTKETELFVLILKQVWRSKL